MTLMDSDAFARKEAFLAKLKKEKDELSQKMETVTDPTELKLIDVSH